MNASKKGRGIVGEMGISSDGNVFHPPFVLHAYCITIFIKIPGPVCARFSRKAIIERRRPKKLGKRDEETERVGKGKQ